MTEPKSERALGPATPADAIYATPKPLVTDFTFGAETTAVFDDMLHRSVPFYDEIQRHDRRSWRPISPSTAPTSTTSAARPGATLLAACCRLERDVTLSSASTAPPAMLARADEELRRANVAKRYVLHNQDLHQGLADRERVGGGDEPDAAVRAPALSRTAAAHGLRRAQPRGCLLLVEKVLEEETLINRLFIKHYYDFKRRNGYADIEIAQKREALENVLIPYRLEENREMLRAVGFRHPRDLLQVVQLLRHPGGEVTSGRDTRVAPRCPCAGAA